MSDRGLQVSKVSSQTPDDERAESQASDDESTSSQEPDDKSGASQPAGEKSKTAGAPWPEDGATLVERLIGDRDAHEDPKPDRNHKLQQLVDETADGGTVTIPEGVYSHGMVIEGRKDLTVRAEPGSVWIVENRRTTDVVRIVDSHDITVRGLGLLHDPKERCSADAIEIYRSHDIRVVNNDLSGSGVAGISTVWSANLEFRGNHIHGSTVYAVRLYDSANLELSGNLIRNNPRKYDGIWRQGVHLNKPFGEVAVTDNLFVDNPAAPVTIQLPETRDSESGELPAAGIDIADNVFARNEPAELSTIAFRTREENRDLAKAIGRIGVRDNCFDTTGGRDELASHVPTANTTEGNRVGLIEVDEAFRVTSPEACSVDVSSPAQWVERFDQRPRSPGRRDLVRPDYD